MNMSNFKSKICPNFTRNTVFFSISPDRVEPSHVSKTLKLASAQKLVISLGRVGQNLAQDILLKLADSQKLKILPNSSFPENSP